MSTLTSKLACPLLALLVAAACGNNQTHPDRDRYVPPDPPVLGCVPNLDGRIDAAELPNVIGIPVSYLVSPAGVERPVDLVGRVDDAGRRMWDLSADDGTDQLAELEAVDPASRWYADSFPGARIAAPVDAGGRIEGLYVQDETALYVLGVASREPDPPEGRTLVVYDEPVALYRFPIAPGSEHVSVGEARDAMIRGLPYAGRDVYEVTVDATGVVALPDLTFEQAHRVRTRVTVEPAAGMTTSEQKVSFLFECFGEVARATSRSNETNEDFTVAAETRRLSL